MTNKKKYQEDINSLVKLGREMGAELSRRRSKNSETVSEKSLATIEESYQHWYTEARLVVKQLIPDRLEEFDQLYEGDGRVRKTINSDSFTIQDWLLSLRAQDRAFGTKIFNDHQIIVCRFLNQIQIVESAKASLDSALANIRQLVQADLFDSELDTSQELAQRGFLRAAGAVAGVVLEKHLKQVAGNHNVKFRKQNPTIGDFNKRLREDGVIELQEERRIQLYGDIRNLCVHNKKREPTGEEVEELIRGVNNVTHTLF